MHTDYYWLLMDAATLLTRAGYAEWEGKHKKARDLAKQAVKLLTEEKRDEQRTDG